MTRPHVAALVEDAWNIVLGQVLSAGGFTHVIVPHLGYAGDDFVRVLARVVLAPDQPRRDEDPDPAARRGWRNFVTAEALNVEVTITLDGEEYVASTDRSGNLDVRLPNPGLEPGRAQVLLATSKAAPVAADIVVVDHDVDFGLLSDIDDTVLKTYLPRPLIAAYNSFVAQEQARRPVRGMAELYAEILDRHPGAPTFYLSTGAWNAAGTLRRFLAAHGFPEGPLLLTDWGPTNTGWFRSGREHKRTALRTLVEDLPHIQWLLVGDDGQRDPAIYAEFAEEHPDRVRAIAIRELGMGEQVLAHGTPVERLDLEEQHEAATPEVRGPDGAVLAARLRHLL